MPTWRTLSEEVDYILNRLHTLRELENYLRDNERGSEDADQHEREEEQENPSYEFGVMVA